MFFFFQAEDGIRDAQESRGLGDVYKRQKEHRESGIEGYYSREKGWNDIEKAWEEDEFALDLSLIHI